MLRKVMFIILTYIHINSCKVLYLSVSIIYILIICNFNFSIHLSLSIERERQLPTLLNLYGSNEDENKTICGNIF